MKLHLPSGLRKAVLACLAALAVALPSTVASGAAFIGSGALVSFLLAQQGAAIDLDGDGIDDEEEDDVLPFAESAFGPTVSGEWTQSSIGSSYQSSDGAQNNTFSSEEDGYYEVAITGNGNSSWFQPQGGTAGGVLKIVRADDSSGFVRIDGSSTWENKCNFGTVWFTSNATGGNNYFKVNTSFLSGTVENVYANGACFWLAATAWNNLSANFILGAASGGSGWVFSSVSDLSHYFEANITTTGSLITTDSIKLGISGTSTFSSIEAQSDFALSSPGNTTAALVLQNGGSIDGILSFADSSDSRYATLKIGSDSTLTVAGLSTSGSDSVQGKIVRDGDSGTATVKITGTGSTATGLVMEAGISLELGAGAEQTFTDSSFSGGLKLGANSTLSIGTSGEEGKTSSFTLTSLSGSGKLEYNGGTLSLSNTSEFTGEIDLNAEWTMASSLTFGTGGKFVVGSNLNMTISQGATFTGDIEYAGGSGKALYIQGTLNGNLTLDEGFLNLSGNATARGVVGNNSTSTITLSTTTGQLDVYGGGTINSSFRNLKQIRIQQSQLTINSDLTAENFAKTNGQIVFTLDDRANGATTQTLQFILTGKVADVDKFINYAQRGTIGSWTFSGSLVLGDLDADGELDSGKTVEFLAQDGTFTISGTLIGDADSVLKKTGTQSLTISSSADVSGFTGGLDVQAGEVSIAVDAENLQAVKVASGATLTLGGSSYSFTSLSGAGSVVAAESASDVALVISNTATTAADAAEFSGTLTGVDVEIAGGYQKLTCSTIGGSLKLSGGTLGIGSSLSVEGDLELVSGTLSITVASDYSGDAILTASEITLTGAIIVDLGDLSGINWDTLTEQKINVFGDALSSADPLITIKYTGVASGKRLVVQSDGSVVLEDAPALEWTGNQDLQWNLDNTTEHGWNTDYSERSSVTFNGTNSGGSTITVTLADTMEVSSFAAKNGNFTFTGNGLYVLGDATFEAKTGGSGEYAYTFAEKLLVDGTLTVFGDGDRRDSGRLVLEKGGAVNNLCASWGSNIDLGDDLVVRGSIISNGAYQNTKAFFGSADGKTHYLSFDTSGGDITVSNMGYEFAQNSDDSYAVGIKKIGTGTLVLGVDVNTDLVIEGGTVRFAGTSDIYTIKGDLIVKNATQSGTEVGSGFQIKMNNGQKKAVVVEGSANITGDFVQWDNKLTLKKGGAVSGRYIVGWGASLHLGDDLEVGSFVRSSTATLASTDSNIHYVLIKTTSDSVSSTFAELNGDGKLFGALNNSGSELTYTGVGYGVTGGIDLTITDAAEIVSHFKVKNSTVRFNAASSIAGQLALATGNVYLGNTLSAYSLSGAGTVQGSGKLTLIGYGSGDGVKTSDSSSATFGSDVNLRLQWVGGTQTLTSAFTGKDIEIARGTLVLTEGGTANGRILLQDNDANAPVGSLKLGKSLSATSMFGANAYSSKYVIDILSTNEDDDIDLVLTGVGYGTEEQYLYGSITVGDEDHRINLEKKGAYHQAFGFADVTFYGDIKVSAGKLRFTSGTATHTATIHGSLSSNATDDVVLALTTMEMAVTGKQQNDGSWSVGSVHHLDINSGTLILGGDLSVTTLTSGQDDTNKKDVSVTFANEDATEDIELISMTVTNEVNLGGTLTLSTGTHATAGKLTLTGGGTISGAVSLQDNTTLELGSGTTLNLSQLSGMGTNASISAANSGTATVVYTLATGHPVNTESTYVWNGNYTFGTGVALEIKGGDMVWNTQYSNGAASKYDIGGAITTLGSLTFNGQGSTEDSNLIYFRKGGSIGGNLSVAWGAHLYLGADLELSANSQLLSGGSNSEISKDATSTVEGDVFILFNVGSPESGDPTTVQKAFSDLFDSTVSAITFTNVGVGKSGANTLELRGSGSVGAAFKVAEGQVVFNGTSFELGGLTLVNNTSVVVKAGTVDLGSAYSFGTGSSLEVNVADDSTAQLTVTEDFGTAANLSLKLSTGSDYVTEGWSFALFDLSDVTTWTDQDAFVAGILAALDEDTTDLLLRGLKYDFTVGDDGIGTISVVRDENAAPKGLVHVVGDEEDTFSWTSATPEDDSWFENRDATDGTYFMNGDDATFYGEGNTVAVTVQTAGLEARSLTLEEGVFTFSGGDLTLTSSLTVTSADAASTTPDAVFSNNVTLSSTGSAFTISGEGHVQFDHLKGNGSGLTIGTGTDHTTVTIKGVNGGQRLGGVGAIEVKAGSTLVLDPVDASGNPTHFDPILFEGDLRDGNYVWGGGTVVLAGQSRAYIINGANTFIPRLLLGTDTSVTTPTLDTLQIGTDATHMRLELGTSNENLTAALRAAKNIVVHSGSTLSIISPNPLQYPNGIPAYSNTIHISGNGTGTSIANDTHVGKDAALSLTGATSRVDFNIELDEAASVFVNSNVLWHKGFFIANGHALTKLGNGIMEVNEIAGYDDEGNLSAADYEAGDVDVQGGVMRFCMAQDSTVAKHVSLGDGTSLQLRGINQTTGERVYTVENLTGSGTVTSDNENNFYASTLRINTDALTADRVDNTSTFTISDVGLTVSVNSSSDTVRTYKMGTGVTLTNLVRLGVEKGILELRAGSTDATAKAHTVAGEINIASGATLQIADAASDKITLTGATLSGSGSLLMKAGTLTLTGGGTSSVVVDIRNGSTIALGGSLTIAGIDTGEWNGSGTAHINLADPHGEDVKLILNVGDGVTYTHAGNAIAASTKLVIDENITLEKMGAGKQTLRNLSAGKVQLTAGTLAFSGTSEVSTKLTATAGTLEVTSGTLTLADYSGSITKLILGASTTLTVQASTNSSAINLVGAELGSGSRLELDGNAMIAINSSFNTFIEGTAFVIGLLDVDAFDLTDTAENAAWKTWEYRLYAAGSGPEGGVASLLDDTMLKHGQHFEDNDGLITISGAYIEHGDLEYREADGFVWTEGDLTKRWWLTNEGVTSVLDVFMTQDNVHFYGGYDPSVTADEVSVLVDGAVTVGNMKITVLNGFTGYDFAADTGTDSKTGDALNVQGNISLNMKENAYANFGLAVLLNKADRSATTISGTGSISFSNVGGGSKYGLVVGSDEGEATVVTITGVNSTAGAHLGNLGAIEVKKGATVILDPKNSSGAGVSLGNITGTANNSDGDGNYFFGEGTVVLAGVSGDYSMLDRNSLLPRLLNASTTNTACTTTLGTLQVGTDDVHITLEVRAYGQRLFTAFRSVKNLVIHEGSALRLTYPNTNNGRNPFQYHDGDYGKLAHTNTIHISGTGTTASSNAALSVQDADSQVDFNMELDGNATVNVNHTATITYKQAGAFIANGHNLTKIGNGVMEIDLLGGYDEDGNVSADDYVAGAVTVSAGTLLYNLAADATIATTMTANGTLTLTGSGASATAPRVYTVQDMRGTGSVGTAANSGAATLRINTATLEANVNNSDAFTLNGVGLAVSVNASGSFYYALSGATLTNLTSLSVEKGVFYLFGEENAANRKEHTIAGGADIAEGAAWYVSGGSAQHIGVTVSGELTGKGSLGVVSDTLTLSSGGADFEGTVDMRNSATLELGASLSTSGFHTAGLNGVDAWNGNSGNASIVLTDDAEDDVTLTINVGTDDSGEALTRSHATHANGGDVTLTIDEDIAVVKTGEGTQEFRNLAAGEVTVQEGTLRFISGGKDNDSTFYVSGITVQEDGTLEIAKTAWAGAENTVLTLENGGQLALTASGATTVGLTIGTLELTATSAEDTAGSISWSDAATGAQVLTFGKLTGTGVLSVEALYSSIDNAYANLVIESMENFSGTLDVDTTNGDEEKERGVLFLGALSPDAAALAAGGNFHQDAGYEATISAATVLTNGFRKTGEGSLTLHDLRVSSGGMLYMNYEGTLSVDSLHVGGNSILFYTSAGTNVIPWELEDWKAQNYTQMSFDIWGALAEDPGIMLEGGSGLCLGILSDTADESIFNLLMGTDGTNGRLHLRNAQEGGDFTYELSWEQWGDTNRYVLYLKVTGIERDETLLWDKNWLTELATAPDSDQMRQSQTNDGDYTALTGGSSFADSALVLGDDTGSRFNFGSQHRVRLVGGPTDETTFASVIGGKLYTETSPVTGEVDAADTYISLRAADGGSLDGVHYHLLVGGSANTSTASVEGSGFKGNTHIQMEGGTVDYIVGGNHMNSSAFSFEGNSYISVGSGQVTGGIVGGSTLVAGRSDDARTYYEFHGNSFIFIYTALSGNTPTTISGGSTGFAAVVGGNAWIGTANNPQELSPSFFGSSHITVDLTNPGVIPTGDAADAAGDAVSGLVFDKAIVGGNYTAYSDAVGEGASTLFEGRSSQRYASDIVITTGETGVTFTAGINGASRRDSAGAGTTRFEGDTNVTINGGTFAAEIAGGFWFGADAQGSHVSVLDGETNVTINGGNVWRVVGGSVSLGGVGSSSQALGDSHVTITGGTFASKGTPTALTQGDVSFVAGGDFYKNTGTATGHVRTADTYVDIEGGDFRDVHIVAGDYVNFSGSGDPFGPVIEGSTHMTVGVNGQSVNITGLVVGGSYLTDDGAAGRVSIDASGTDDGLATHVVIGSNAKVVAESSVSGHKHVGVAVVAGHVLIDEGDDLGSQGEHTVEITGDSLLEVTGGEIYGSVVGGSYTNDSENGTNHLLLDGDSTVKLTGGIIIGSVFGGHYSDNRTVGDELKLGNVRIEVEGSSVQGNIVGGSRRAVSEGVATENMPHQGDITIQLKSGTLEGNVFAAGQHTSTKLESDLSVTTDSTTVEISADFVFGTVRNPESGLMGSTKSFIVSGGYDKATSSANGSDNSVVTGLATLKFTDASEYKHLSGVSYRDFDRVELETNISAEDFTVMNRADSTKLTKAGSGTLTLGGGVHVEGAIAEDYTGGIDVEAGILQVGANQGISASALSFGMVGRMSGNSDAAYLQGVNGATLSFDSDLVQAKAADSVTVTLTGVEGTGLRVGTYYLASGLDEDQASLLFNDKEFFTAVDADGDEMTFAEGYRGEVYVNRDGCLVLRVRRYNTDEWIWDGTESADGKGNIWGSDAENWTKDDGDSDEENVVFDNGAELQDVLLGRTQSPDSVHVQSGNYTFANLEGTNEPVEGLDMTGRFIVGGTLLVEGDESYGYEDASAALNDYNKKVGEVELRLGGQLILGHEQAIQEEGNATNGAGTAIWFHGGKLVIAEDAEGAPIFDKDISWLVQEQEEKVDDQTSSSDYMIRVQVGNRTEETMVARIAVEDGVPAVSYGVREGASGVEYGTRDNNELIKQMFAFGLEKDGRGTLEVNWAENGESTLGGRFEVLDGTLRYHLHGAGNSENNVVTLDPTDGLQLTRGSTVEYVTEGKGVLEVAGSIVQVDGEVEGGVSRIVLGSTEVHGSNTSTSSYRMAVDNSGFAGELELRGDGSQTTGNQVELTADNALGGKDTTLVLNGMHLAYSSTGAHVIEAGTVKVTEDSTTYVGGVLGGAANNSITIAGVVEGSGTLAIMDGLNLSHSIVGEISDFDGVLDTGSGVWTLKQDALSTGIVKAQLEGDGRVVIGDGEGKAVRLEGKVGGNGDFTAVENKLGADGRVVIVNTDNTSQGSLVFNGNVIELGAEQMTENASGKLAYSGEEGLWNGGVLSGRSGTYSLVSGNTAEITYKDGVQLEVNTARNAVVNAGGTDGSMFDRIAIHEGGQLQGARGLIRGTELELHLTDANMNDKDRYLIQMNEGSTGVTVNTLDDFHLIFTNKAFVDVLKAHRDPVTELSYIHVVENGKLTFRPAVNLADLLAYDPNVGNNVLLSVLGFSVLQNDETRPGDLQLKGSSGNVYLVVEDGGDPDHVSDYGRMSGFLATVVDEDQTLDVTIGDLPAGVPDDAPNPDAFERDIEAGGMLVNNLVGLGNSTLAAHKAEDATGDVTLVLDNSIIDPDAVDSPDKFKPRVGVDTWFEGSIVADAGVNVKKIGQGTLTVGSETDRKSGLRTEGDVRLEDGGLELRGGDNRMGSLTFAYEKGSENKGLTLGSGSTTTVGDIIEETTGNHVQMEEGSKLVVTGSGELKGTSFGESGTLNVHGKDANLTLDGSGGSGTNGVDVVVSDGGSLTLTNGASKVGGETRVTDGTLSLEGGASISGEGDVWLEKDGHMSLSDHSTVETDGALKLDEGSVMDVDNSSVVKARNGAQVDGTLNLNGSSGNELTGLSGSGTISGDGASLTLHGDNTWGGSLSGTGTLRVAQGESLYLDHMSEGDGWTLINEGSLTIDVSNTRDCTGLGKLEMGKGSQTTLVVNTDQGRSMGGLDLGELSWAKDAQLTIRSTGTGTFYGDQMDLGMLAGELQDGAAPNIRMAGAALLHYEASGLYKGEDGHLYVGMAPVRNNLFYLENMEKNPKAGADMFWDVSDPSSAAWRELTSDPMTALVSDLYKAYAAMADMVVEGRDAELAKTLAAGAGASVSVLGSALSQDIQRQLSAIRTRTASMGGEQAEGKPLYHVWLNAEGSYHKLDADGMAPGYSLNSWGGTVGVEFDVSAETTVGVALSAMYGDLKTDAADSARGNMDTTYLSGFARMARGAWMHTVVLSAGLADVDLNRTVSYGAGSYSTTGNTSGYAVGLLYEIGYSQVMNAEATLVLQPIFNVELRRSMISGYTEGGSDAGLKVDDIEHNVVTFGLGTRLQQVVGAKAVNRSAVFEARALLKADLGDHSGKADNRLIKGSVTRELESAEIGSVGVEIGAGLHIPVGSSGSSIFVDASLELRSGYTSMDANIGYRASF